MPPQRASRHPAAAPDRAGEIVAAFVGLIADRGLEAVTLDDVAIAAGVQRSMIRHYVGNRVDLVRAACDTLTSRYEEIINGVIGQEPSPATVIAYLFSPEWNSSMEAENRALGVLMDEARRDDGTRQRLHDAYRSLIDAVAQAIRRQRPEVDPDSATTAAYQIICLAEANSDLQDLGFPAHLAQEASALATALVERAGGAPPGPEARPGGDEP